MGHSAAWTSGGGCGEWEGGRERVGRANEGGRMGGCKETGGRGSSRERVRRVSWDYGGGWAGLLGEGEEDWVCFGGVGGWREYRVLDRSPLVGGV